MLLSICCILGLKGWIKGQSARPFIASFYPLMRSNGKNNTTFTIIFYNINESCLIFSIYPLLSLKIKEKCKKGKKLWGHCAGPFLDQTQWNLKFGLGIPLRVPHKFYLMIFEICPALTCIRQIFPFCSAFNGKFGKRKATQQP